MRSRRRWISLAACLVALAAPSAALAQTPGDEQYSDPFGGSQDEGSGASPGNDEEAQPQPTATPAPAPAAPAAQAEAAPEATAAQELPRTGTDALITLASGTILFAGGVVLRLRA